MMVYNDPDMVFVRFLSSKDIGTIHYSQRTKFMTKYHEWLRENVNYKYDFGMLSGIEVGIFLKPEDALLFKLKFGI